MEADISENIFARLINIAGRQRMLSQRIGFIISMLHNTSEPGHDIGDDLSALLKNAVNDFTLGYAILLQGDRDQGLPHFASARVANVLDGRGDANGSEASSGRATIDRFLLETGAALVDVTNGRRRGGQQMSDYSAFVLGPVLQTLQKIVEALEADFEDEMLARRTRRSADVELVMMAAGEIQKASKFSRMIALNAKISANRAGPHGLEFGALTEEIKKISNNITESSQEIMRHLDHV